MDFIIRARRVPFISGLTGTASAFTLSAERGAIEVTLWEDYLVFAALFGQASFAYR